MAPVRGDTSAGASVEETEVTGGDALQPQPLPGANPATRPLNPPAGVTVAPTTSAAPQAGSIY